jgi:hypothetical protein
MIARATWIASHHTPHRSLERGQTRILTDQTTQPVDGVAANAADAAIDAAADTALQLAELDAGPPDVDAIRALKADLAARIVFIAGGLTPCIVPLTLDEATRALRALMSLEKA